MALSALALITALHSSNLASPAQLATFQQQSIEAATVVTFRSPEQARAAAIGLHHLLLAGDWKSGQLILQLDETEQKKLLPFATSMAPATEWQQQQLQAWQQQQAAQHSLDVTAQGIPGYSCYETVEETFAAAQQLVTTYPQYATFQSIGSAWAKSKGRDGFDVFVLKITKNNGKTDKPKLLINSAIHAREYTTAATALQFARELLNSTGKDADVDWMLEQNEVHLVLHTNPEGRKIAETGVSWRKNINDQQVRAALMVLT
ncbi:MAG: M14 family zinc carboxypeptidase [Rheinheimera sp.]|nr:M14 family zinc carboxypeptidase [Rheinheimera sp.]